MTSISTLTEDWRKVNASCAGREPDDNIYDRREALEWEIADTRGGPAFKLELALSMLGKDQTIVTALVRSAYRDCIAN